MTNPTPPPPGRWSKPRAAERPFDWSSIRDRVDLADVAVRLMGEPPGRKGEHGKRLWWRCPFHQDNNPSFCIEPGRTHWRCFGCGEHGDAVSLVMKYNRVAFREAVAFIASDVRLGASSWPPPRSKPRPGPKPWPLDDPEARGRHDEATKLVARSIDRLWTSEGRRALDALRDRGLNDATIRLGRLGYAPDASLPKAGGGRTPAVRGVTIPWFGRNGVELVKVRRLDDGEPRYIEAFRLEPTFYPGPPLVELPHHGAVVIAEGELDALLLTQELESLAVVITAGSASQRPDELTLNHLLAAHRLFLATDSDDAGDRCASAWLKRARRVRPPEPHNDWTDAHRAGINLRWWWIRHLVADPDAVEERAAIREYDGGLTRDDAERAASRIGGRS
jgi:DNA primase